MPAQIAAQKPPQRPKLKTNFRKARSFEPLYTGGAVAFTPDGQWAITTLGEEAVVTEIETGVEIARILGDTEELTSLSLTPSGSHLITASRSLSLKTYSLPDFTLIRSTARCHDAPVTVMSIDPTSTLVATGSSDATVKVWDIAGGYTTHVFRGHGGVVSALCWNMPAGEAEAPSAKGKGKRKSLGAAEEAPSERKIELFTGATDGRIRLWDLRSRTATQKATATFSGHVSVVRGLAVTADGRTLISGSRDRTVMLWDLASRHLRDTLPALEGLESVGALAPDTKVKGLSSGKDLFWTGGESGEIRIWSAETGQVVLVQPGASAKPAVAESRADEDGDEAGVEATHAITEVHYIAASSTLISVHADQNIVLRSISEGLAQVRQLVGFNDEIIDLAMLSPSASESGPSQAGHETHLAVATNSAQVRVYSLGTNDVALLSGHSDVVLCLDRSPDAHWLVSGAKDKSALVWAWSAASQSAAAPSTDDGDVGERVYLGDAEATVPAARAGEWKCLAVCEGHTESVGAVAMARRPSAPGALGAPFMLTASQDRTVKVWDLSSLSAMSKASSTADAPSAVRSLLTLKIHDKDINALDVSPNNALVLSASQDRTAKVFALTYTPAKSNGEKATAALRLLATCKGHKKGVWSAKFSPVDQAFATASGDRTIRLWSLKDFSCVKTFEGHTNSVLRVNFITAGMQMLSCASDGLVKLWNVRDEQCVATMDGHEDKVWALAISADQKTVVSAGSDSVVNFWEDRTEAEAQEKAKGREEMVLKEQDFANYLTLKDYRNAIVLALSMDQPRRLLNLFTQVGASRPEGDAATSAGILLESALRSSSGTGSGLGLSASSATTTALSQAGVLRGVPSRTPMSTSANMGDSKLTGSITGLAAVDSVIRTLKGAQLAQLLTYVRDWNTSVRTSAVAQTVLHAILRFHSAEDVLAAFGEGLDADQMAASAGRATFTGASGLQSAEEARASKDAVAGAPNARAKNGRKPKTAGLAETIDGLIPYTERHYARADRTLTESHILEYTLASMAVHLGFGDEEEFEDRVEDRDGDGEDGDVQAQDGGANVPMNGVTGRKRRDAMSASESEDENEDEEMEE